MELSFAHTKLIALDRECRNQTLNKLLTVALAKGILNGGQTDHYGRADSRLRGLFLEVVLNQRCSPSKFFLLNAFDNTIICGIRRLAREGRRQHRNDAGKCQRFVLDPQGYERLLFCNASADRSFVKKVCGAHISHQEFGFINYNRSVQSRKANSV